MIISHKHKFIFVKTAKTAGTSIEMALAGICGDDDIITPLSDKEEALKKEMGLRQAQNYKIGFKHYGPKDILNFLFRGKRLQFYNHMSGSDIKKYLPKEKWDNYYKFCFERNPWDKTMSWYYYRGKKNNGGIHYANMLEFLKSGIVGEMPGFELYTKGGILIVDDIFRFEAIEDGLRQVSKKLKLTENIEMPKYKAKSDSRPSRKGYREELSSEEAELIATIFAREINYLGYQF